MRNSPNLYLFNPTCEYAIGNGSPNWQAKRLLQNMEADLDILPMVFARSDDFVLVENLPSKTHLETLSQLGLAIPGFIQKKEAFKDIKIQSREWNSLHPWGWSPAVHQTLQPFKNSCSAAFKNSPVYQWKTGYREMYSKKFGLEILSRVLNEFPNEHFIPEKLKARICTTKKDFEASITEWDKLMVKAPWSSSGRGLQPITKTPVHPKVWEKLLGIVREQGYAMAEPLLDKKLDIAFQFKAEKGQISFIGISNFTADAKGQYLGNNLNGLPDDLDPKLIEFVHFVPQIIVEPLIRVLETSEIAPSYEGYFGVDALIYENENGEFKINPCLEINLRYNMGLLSISLEQFLVPGIKGIFRTWYKPGHSYFDFKQDMEQKHPIVLTERKLKAGFVSLTDPLSDSQFGAYILV